MKGSRGPGRKPTHARTRQRAARRPLACLVSSASIKWWEPPKCVAAMCCGSVPHTTEAEMVSESPRAPPPPHSCICLHLLLLTAANSVIEFHSPVQHRGADSYFTPKYYSAPPAVLFCRTVFNLNLFSLGSPTRTNMGIITSSGLFSVIFSPPASSRRARRASASASLIHMLLLGSFT